ncbi:recombinase family protein [Sphingomonas sp. SUN019]|nr:recombinase family protein [Sphingomonas sp. SUN019]
MSTPDQEREGYSIPAQIKLLEDYAALNGIIVTSTHVDVETAKKAGRTAFGEMLRCLRRDPEIGILLVEKTDRLYRNLKDWAIIDDLGIEVHFVKENFILSDDCRSSEKFMHGIKVLVAKSYIDNLSEESTKGMLEKARQGLWPSYAPLDYANVVDPNGRKIVVVEPEVGPLVALLFEWFATGSYSLTQIMKKARLAGLKGRRNGRPIAASTVQKVLRNRFYTGSFDWAGVTYAGVHEPLVSIALWDVVQEILDGRAASNIRADPHDFPFSGLIKCGHCGCAIVAEIKKARYIYYHCTGYRGKCPERYVRQEVLEEHFIELLRQLKCDDQQFALIRQALCETQADADLEDRVMAFRKRGQLAGNPGALVSDGVALVDLARAAYKDLAWLPAVGKRELVSLLISSCTWANGRLTATFNPPFEGFADHLSRAAHPAADHCDQPGATVALKAIFHHPAPGTLRLIARFNAMIRSQDGGETERCGRLNPSSELDVEAA